MSSTYVLGCPWLHEPSIYAESEVQPEVVEAEEPEQPEAVQPVAVDDAATIPDDSAILDAGETSPTTGDNVETVDAIADDPKPTAQFSDGLTGAALAERLGRDAGSISKHSKKGDLPQWSKELDPDGISWERRGARYFPVD
ncbi:MAG: hypothetical protein WBB28_10765 [Crinalium sp.]